MILYDIWLREAARLTPRRILEARERFGSAEQVYHAVQAGEGRAFFTASEWDKLKKAPLDAAHRVLEACGKGRIQALSFADAGYPAPLRSLYDPPAVLYVRGRLPDFVAQPALSIVGQRKATPRGLATAQRFAHVLSAHGFTIVSGMAYGVDSAAHRGALEGPSPTATTACCGRSWGRGPPSASTRPAPRGFPPGSASATASSAASPWAPWWWRRLKKAAA